MVRRRRPIHFASLVVAGLLWLPAHLSAAEQTPEEVCRQMSHVTREECLAAAALLMRAEVDSEIDLTIRVEATDGRVTYTYEDIPSENASGDGRYCKAKDELVLPTGKTIRFLTTATDVIYSWRVPALSIDSTLIPGRINEAFIDPVEKAGMIEGRLLDEGKGTETVTDIRFVADAYDAKGTLKPQLFCKGR